MKKRGWGSFFVRQCLVIGSLALATMSNANAGDLFFSNFDDGTLQGWGTIDYSGLSTAQAHSGGYSLMVNDLCSGCNESEVYKAITPTSHGILDYWAYIPSGNPTEIGTALTPDGYWLKHPSEIFRYIVFSDGAVKWYDGSDYRNFATPAAVALDQWNHFTVEWNTSTLMMNLAINGTSYGSGANYNGGTEVSLVQFSSNCWACTGDRGYFDDIRVSTAPVPEPETYAMMLAGLALLGGVARRNKGR